MSAIVRYKGIRNSIPCDYILPYKLFGISVADVGEGLGLNPLCKVISCSDEIPFVGWSPRKGTYYVETPLSECPREVLTMRPP